MSTLVTRLASWARDLQPADLPPSVRERALLQHLSVAGAVAQARGRPEARALLRASSRSGAAPLVGGGSSSRRDAVRLHAGLSALLDYDDYLFLGHTGHGAVPAAWAFARGHTLDQVLTATVAANEVAGRVGCSLLLGPQNDQAAAIVTSVAAATAAGLLDGLDATQLAHAIALSIAVPPSVPWSTLAGGAGRVQVGAVPAVCAIDAVELAGAGLEGPLDTLDQKDGVLSRLCWIPLRAAFTGLGEAWLTETLAFKLHPVATALQVPVQAFAEVLRRHVRAADKRLRADQIDRIEVAVSLPTWAVEEQAGIHPQIEGSTIGQSLRRAIGVLAHSHALTLDQLDHDWVAARAEAIGAVVARVEVRHDWAATLGLAEHLIDAAAPLLAGVTMDELLSLPRRAREAYGFGPGRPSATDLLGIARLRPDRMAERIRHASGDLADADLAGWQFRFDTDLVVHTSRGGRWPERRSLPEGSPGWNWHKTVDGVLEKYSGAVGELDRSPVVPSSARALLGSAGSDDAPAWIEQMMGGAAGGSAVA